MTAVLCASCFLIASKIGRRGRVDAILTAMKGEGRDEGDEQRQKGKSEVRRGRENLCRARVREKRVEAHMADGECPG